MRCQKVRQGIDTAMTAATALDTAGLPVIQGHDAMLMPLMAGLHMHSPALNRLRGRTCRRRQQRHRAYREHGDGQQDRNRFSHLGTIEGSEQACKAGRLHMELPE